MKCANAVYVAMALDQLTVVDCLGGTAKAGKCEIMHRGWQLCPAH